MSSIDYFALSIALKGLIISFIISIFLVNSLLIFMTVRKSGFLYRPRNLLIISLAIGDIFLALFPGIIFAKIIFIDKLDISCRTFVTAVVYAYFLIHFVYGAGLITLAVEMLLRYKRQSGAENTKLVKSLAYSAVPWILGLVVVLPLALAEFDWEACISKKSTDSSLLAMFGVSVILPAVLSVIVCIVVCCIRLVPVQQEHLAYSYPSKTPVVVLATYDTASGYQLNPDNRMVPSAETQVILPTCSQYSTQNVQQQYVYPPSQQAPISYPAVGYVAHSNMIISAPVHPIQPQSTTATSFTDPNREKVLLLISAIVFFVCVVPFTAYLFMNTTVQMILICLMAFRSILTPLIWIINSRR